MRSIARLPVLCAAITLSTVACSDDDITSRAAVGPDGGSHAGGKGGGGGSETGGAATGGGGATATGGSGNKDGGAGSDAGPFDGGNSVLDRLKGLGADTDLPTDPVDGKGAALPAGYHPLRKRYAAIDPRHEIYFAGPTFGGQREGLLDDGFVDSGDMPGTFGEMLTPADPTWFNNYYRTGVAADVDGDGIQEIVAVYYVEAQKTLFAKVIHGGATATDKAREDLPFALATGVEKPTMYEDAFQHSIAAVNVDDDAADEIVLGCNDLYVFDDPAHSFKTLYIEPLGAQIVSVEAGDFDAAPVDPRDEFVVFYSSSNSAGTGHYQVFDGLEKTFKPNDRAASTNLNDGSGSAVSYEQAFLVTGNFDRDPADEIAWFGRMPGNDWELMIMDDKASDYHWFNSFRHDFGGNLSFVAADLDGDHIDEISLINWIVDGLETIDPSSSQTPVQAPGSVYAPEHVTFTDHGMNAHHTVAANVTRTGDTNLRPTGEELVVIDDYDRIAYGAFGPTGTFAWTTIGPASDRRWGDVLVAANVDHDSEIVRYDNQHELLYSDPKIVVAMSAPPFYAGTNQEDTSSTTFGTGNATQTSKETTIGFSVGFSFGYESSDPLGIHSSSFKVSVNQSFDSTAMSAAEQQQWVTYSTGAEDSVVFTVTPFDVYYYTVVSATDPTQEGKTLSINIPRKPQTLLATSAYYDQFVDEPAKSAPLFTHKVGDPRSYPTVAQRDVACGTACFKSDTAITVGQGTGSTTIEIDKVNQKGFGTSYDFSVSVESEFGVGGVTAGVSAGFHYGYEVQTTTTDTTMFSGTLGSLEGLTPDKTYSAGLFAYRKPWPGTSGKDLLSIDYWVE